MYTAIDFGFAPMIDINNRLVPPVDPFAVNYTTAFGELVQLQFTVKTSPPHFAVGQRFVFNPCLFGNGDGTVQAPAGFGWVIDILSISGGGTFDIYLRTDGSATSNATQRNGWLSCALLTATTMKVTFVFFACEDYKTYMQPAPRNNYKKLQTASADVERLANTTDSIWGRGQSYVDIFMYEADIDFNPVTAHDPYVRLAATPGTKTMSVPIKGKFYNDGVGAQAFWDSVSGRPSEFCLWTFQTTVSGYKIAEMIRRGAPVMSKDLETNYTFDEETLMLMKDSENVVGMVLSRPTGWVTSEIIVRLLRTDAATGAQYFPNEYEIKEQLMPASDLTPYNPAGADVITTPITWSDFGANSTSLQFGINGAHLRTEAEYSLVVLSYNTLGDKGSTTTKPARVINNVRGDSLALALTGNIDTFAYQYNGNDVQMAMFQRFRASVAIDGTTYGAGAAVFGSRLREARARYEGDGRVIAEAVYNAVSANSITTPAMTFSLLGANYVFGAIFRTPFTGVPAPSATRIYWEFDLEEPTAGGGTTIVTVKTEQQVRRFAPDPNVIIRYLDYAQYLIGNKVVIDTFCSDVDLYVVEIEVASNPPQKSVTALLFYDDGDGGTTIRENNGFAPVFLPRLQEDGLRDVDANFTGLFASFLVDISLLPRGFEGAAVGCILQE